MSDYIENNTAELMNSEEHKNADLSKVKLIMSSVDLKCAEECLAFIMTYRDVKHELEMTIKEQSLANWSGDREMTERLRGEIQSFEATLEAIYQVVMTYAPVDILPYNNEDFSYERRFLLFRFIHGMSYEQLAEELYVSRSTICRIAAHMGLVHRMTRPKKRYYITTYMKR